MANAARGGGGGRTPKGASRKPFLKPGPAKKPTATAKPKPKPPSEYDHVRGTRANDAFYRGRPGAGRGKTRKA